MGAMYRTHDLDVLAVIETTPGEEEVPAPAANAVRVHRFSYAINFENVADEDENSRYLDVPRPLIGGGSVEMTYGVKLKGSGTPGEAPEFGVFLKACGFHEAVLAADESDTAAGGGSNWIELAATASAETQFYQGFEVEITSGPGAGQSRIITSYIASARYAIVDRPWDTEPEATSEYTIAAGVRYIPASVDLPTATLYAYLHPNVSTELSRLIKQIGAAGSFSLECPTRGLPMLDFTMSGKFVAPSEVATPTGLSFDSSDGVPFIGAQVTLGAPDAGTLAATSSLSLDMGGAVEQADNPAEAYGYDYAQITRRRITGSISPRMEKLATRDAVLEFVTNEQQQLVAAWGQSAGNKVRIVSVGIQYTGANPTDVSGFRHEDLPFAQAHRSQGFAIAFQ